MVIRELARTDVPAVIALSRQLADHVNDPNPQLTDDAIAELAFENGHWFNALVMEDDGNIVGFTAYVRCFELHTNSKILLVTDLVISNQVRRSGCGQKLLKTLRELASQEGCRSLKLEVWKFNEQAQAFYAKHGAQHIADVDLLQITV